MHLKKNPISLNNKLEIEIKCDLGSDEDCVKEDCEELSGVAVDVTKFPEVAEECKQHKGVPEFPKKYGIYSNVKKVTKECRKHIQTHKVTKECKKRKGAPKILEKNGKHNSVAKFAQEKYILTPEVTDDCKNQTEILEPAKECKKVKVVPVIAKKYGNCNNVTEVAQEFGKHILTLKVTKECKKRKGVCTVAKKYGKSINATKNVQECQKRFKTPEHTEECEKLTEFSNAAEENMAEVEEKCEKGILAPAMTEECRKEFLEVSNENQKTNEVTAVEQEFGKDTLVPAIAEECNEGVIAEADRYGICSNVTKVPHKRRKGLLTPVNPKESKKHEGSPEVNSEAEKCNASCDETIVPNQDLEVQQSIKNSSDTQTNRIVTGKSKAIANETSENRTVASTIPTEDLVNFVKDQKAEVKKTVAKSQLPKDKDATHKSFRKEEVSNIKNLPRVEKTAVVISILREEKIDDATSICKDDKSNVATRHELKHRCTLCDFQTSFRGKLSTHLISQHSGVRKEKERKNITEK